MLRTVAGSSQRVISGFANNLDRFRGRPALVTGASSGIGAGIARELVKLGMRVAACARDVDRLKEIQTELEDGSGSLLPIKCDLRKEKGIMAMFETIKKELGGIDLCVNNAGLNHNCPLLSGTNEQWKEMLEVNVLAPCISTREAIRSMRERDVDDGYVFNISSMSGHRLPDKTRHFYAGNKHAVRVYTEGVRRELREIDSHIRITAISPGNVNTEFVKRMYAYDKKEQAMQMIPSYTNLEVADIVDLVVYSLSTHPRVEIGDFLIRPTESLI